jgi:hypothetical protein
VYAGRVHPSATKRHIAVGSEGEPGLGRRADGPVSMRRLYVLDRRTSETGDGRIEIRPVHAREAVMELVRHSYLRRMIGALGLEGNHLEELAGIARIVPVRRLTYPSGMRELPAVVEAVAADVVADG